jgi:L-asparaginase II
VASQFDILFERKRANIAEILVHGALCWVHGDKVIHSLGDDPLIYGRSLMKPFQMKVFKDELKDFTAEQQAISIASHSGTQKHIAMAQSLLKQSDWGKLQTPISAALGSSDEQSRWHHPCSGKHAGIILGCMKKGWPTDNYLSQNHPYHKAYMSELEYAMGLSQQSLIACPDGCGLPTLGHHVSDLARSFSYLAKTSDSDWIWSAMTKQPWFIGGDNRMDSDIMLATQGKVLAKEGADGLLGLAIKDESYPEGLGVVLKVAHGRDEQTMKLIAQKILASLGFDWQVEECNQEQVAYVSDSILP